MAMYHAHHTASTRMGVTSPVQYAVGMAKMAAQMADMVDLGCFSQRSL